MFLSILGFFVSAKNILPSHILMTRSLLSSTCLLGYDFSMPPAILLSHSTQYWDLCVYSSVSWSTVSPSGVEALCMQRFAAQFPAICSVLSRVLQWRSPEWTLSQSCSEGWMSWSPISREALSKCWSSSPTSLWLEARVLTSGLTTSCLRNVCALSGPAALLFPIINCKNLFFQCSLWRFDYFILVDFDFAVLTTERNFLMGSS